MRRTWRAGVLAAAAALAIPGAAVAAPSFQVTDAGPAVSGLSTADQVAGTLLGPGVTLDGAATINGTATAGSYAAALPSFGRFSSGEADLGIPDGLVIGANALASSFATGGYQSVIATDRDDTDLYGVVNAAGLCGGGGASACINNATSVEFSVRPTARYLKFEYALGITEVGFWGGSSWGGDVFTFPDGFALFVGGTQVADNCAVLPRTSTYVTMQTAGIVPTAVSGNNRATAQANLDARAADTATPPVTPNGFAYSTQDGSAAVKFMTVPLTCVADVNAAYLANTAVPLKIVVADANDSAVPPAVFLKGGSVRFSATPTPSAEVDLPPAPVAPPAAPVAPPAGPPAAPAPAGSPVTPLAPRQVKAPRSGSAPVVLQQPLRFEKPGRYTFIYVDTATGKRIPQIRGSRVGSRSLPGRYSAPVFRTASAGRKVVLASRFDRKRLPRSIDQVALRIVHKAPDGALTEVTLDEEGNLI